MRAAEEEGFHSFADSSVEISVKFLMGFARMLEKAAASDAAKPVRRLPTSTLATISLAWYEEMLRVLLTTASEMALIRP